MPALAAGIVFPANPTGGTCLNMKRSLPIYLGLLAIWLVSFAPAQDATLAGLNHETAPDITRSETTSRVSPPAGPSARVTVPLPDSALSRSAAEALFVHSNLSRPRTLADRAWRRHPRDGEALFVVMESSGMQADDAAMLDAAVRLCGLGETDRDDPRVRLAAVRIRESAANTPQFRSIIPQLRSLLASSPESWPDLDCGIAGRSHGRCPRPRSLRLVARCGHSDRLAHGRPAGTACLTGFRPSADRA